MHDKKALQTCDNIQLSNYNRPIQKGEQKTVMENLNMFFILKTIINYQKAN